MLRIIIGDEGFNETTQTFEQVDPIVVDLEHSLVSVSKWESEYQRPFLTAGEKTSEEIVGYLKAMVIDPEVDPEVLLRCSAENIKEIQEYIDSSQSATTFGTMPDHHGPGETITSELVYYWLVAFTIPFECQYWHLNRLFALIRICNIKNSTPQEMSRHELAIRNRDLNAKRRAQLGTSG